MTELNESGPGEKPFTPALDANELLNVRAEQTVADALLTVPEQILKGHIRAVMAEQLGDSATAIDIDSLARQVHQQLEAGLNGLDNAQELSNQIEQNGFSESNNPDTFWANRANHDSVLGNIMIDAHRVVGEAVKQILRLPNK